MTKLRIQSKKAHGVGIPVTNSHGISAVYANSIGISATIFDFTLIFTEVGQFPGEKGPIQRNEIKIAVTLPIGMAGGVIGALHQMIEANTALIEEQAATAKKLEALIGQKLSSTYVHLHPRNEIA